VRLDAELARAAIRDVVAGALGLSLEDAASGAFAIANATMIRAIKAVTTYRGRDPRDFTLVAFGGNGPIHAAAIARSLQIPRVVVPPAPGLFSAFGLLAARPEHHAVRSFLERAHSVDPARLEQAFADLERAAVDAVRLDGYADPVTFERLADLRYAGQAYELTVRCPDGRLGPAEVAMLAERFEVEHEQTYGHRARGEPVEIVNLRGVTRIEQPQVTPIRCPEETRATEWGERPVFFGPGHRGVSTSIIQRSDLDRQPRRGPFVVEEYDATVVVPPDDRAWLDEWGNIVIAVEELGKDG
jgi:N-methylhydantoinase A